MMNNKVLIRLWVPEVDEVYDLFIPVNEVIWKVNQMIVHCVNGLSSGALDREKKYVLINKTTGVVYSNSDLVIETDIRNATELLLVSLLYY